MTSDPDGVRSEDVVTSLVVELRSLEAPLGTWVGWLLEEAEPEEKKTDNFLHDPKVLGKSIQGH